LHSQDEGLAPHRVLAEADGQPKAALGQDAGCFPMLESREKLASPQS
jgi:hypothetical protein